MSHLPKIHTEPKPGFVAHFIKRLIGKLQVSYPNLALNSHLSISRLVNNREFNTLCPPPFDSLNAQYNEDTNWYWNWATYQERIILLNRSDIKNVHDLRIQLSKLPLIQRVELWSAIFPDGCKRTIDFDSGTVELDLNATIGEEIDYVNTYFFNLTRKYIFSSKTPFENLDNSSRMLNLGESLGKTNERDIKVLQHRIHDELATPGEFYSKARMIMRVLNNGGKINSISELYTYGQLVLLTYVEELRKFINFIEGLDSTVMYPDKARPGMYKY